MNKINRNILSKALGVAALLAVGSQASALTVIKIASASPLSGGQSDFGTQIRNGTQLAVNQYKAQFAKLGFDLQFTPYDDQADPATGTAVARKIVADKQVLAMVGPMNSGVTIPASTVLADAHIGLVAPASTANLVTDRGLKNVNRVVARDDAQGPAAANFMVSKFKPKKVYIINDKTTYGEGLAGEVEKTLKAKGVQVVANEGTEEKSDFSAIVSKIQLQKPDVIYFGGIYNQAGILAKQLREKGVTTPLVGGDGFDSDEMATIAGAGATNIFYTTGAAPVEALPAAKNFAAQYTKTFGKAPQGFAIYSYDSATVVLRGILNAINAGGKKLPTREQVESSIRKSNYVGLLSGTVQFNGSGDRRAAKLYVMNLEKGKTSLNTTLSVKPTSK